ncbi:MAG: PqiC family protein [Desulfuromonadales bacterium]
MIMRKQCHLVRIAILLLVILLLLPGCIKRSAPQVTYFTLLTLKQMGDTQTLAALPELKLGVGPITIPDRLKRAQIATSRHGNEFEFNEFNRWAGMLETDLTEVLGENLNQLLGTEKVGFFPWAYQFKPDYRIMVDVLRLEGALAGDVILSARWMVLDAAGKDVLARGKSEYQQQAEGKDFADLIRAESQLVGMLSKELAGKISILAK